ncbi:hypothetical protein AQ505_09795 [Pedobacter sp. PACM 27299]|uniref:TlpA family protein disulfide reductase n=1 Tax=Pedobacter sp. PACM 27299 TaxID=1727164 RepID=UPI00070667E9|nr:thioredoxin family protein [Pedobacter sp. PACM 27299]ALL05758.1 hypothetical protein AQ505_09795 [Pedobacter sp. PACM 27299]
MEKSMIIICLLFLSYQLGFSRSNKKYNETIINVKIIDKNLDKTKVPVIILQTSECAFGGVEFIKSMNSNYEQVAVKEGNVFSISSSSDVFYMRIYYAGQKVPGGSYYWIDNIYIIKSGSDLSIYLDNANVRFSGEASVIPNIQSQIIKYSYKTSESQRKLLNDKEYLPYFQELDKSLDSALQLQLGVIESNKTILGDYYVKLLTANCYGYRYYSQLRAYNFELMQNELYFKTFKKYYNEKIKVRIIPEFTNDLLDASPMFTNFLIEEFLIVDRIGHEEYGPMLPDSCIRNILKKINTNHSGILRDKLLTLFALHTNRNENALPFFDEILFNVKNKKYNNLLINKIDVKRNNIPFKDFNLENETGEIYTLSSFNKKVIVLDFWFTGCENCAVLNEAMKPIVKYFSSNPQIQFVSVSIDKSKKQWLKSVHLGNYTHSEGINLYTNGEGSNHDLINYYNITNYPTVFVIKDGAMYSSLPPRPSPNTKPGQELSENALRLIELLEKAMKF